MRNPIARSIAISSIAAFAAFTEAATFELLQAPDTAPRYRVSNLRIEDDRFGRAVMVFDYERTRDGDGIARVAGRTKDGPLAVSFLPPISDRAGTVRLGKGVGLRGSYDFEFYLVTPAIWAEQRFGDCLLSNTVRIGAPGPSPNARPWTDAERAAFEKQQRADQTPDSLPEGYRAVDSRTLLLPGMSVKASRYAEWVDAEILALTRTSDVTIRYHDRDRGVTIPREKWLAIDPEIAARATTDPAGFQPSIRVLPGRTHPLPRRAVALDPDIDLARGVPLLLARGTEWKTVFVLEDKQAIVRVRYADHPGKFDFDHQRDELAIDRETLTQLKSGAGVDEFADNVLDDDPLASVGPGRNAEAPPWGGPRNAEFHVIDRNYPIEARIPRRAKVLPKEVELPPDTRVAYCWAWRWRNAKVVEDRGAAVIIKEEDDVSTFVTRVKRDQLIVEDATLRKLQRSRKTAAAELKKTLRTWTDSSGEHKVEARFVAVEGDRVKLKTGTGREIELPLARLSEEDQALLAGVESETDNPFE